MIDIINTDGEPDIITKIIDMENTIEKSTTERDELISRIEELKRLAKFLLEDIGADHLGRLRMAAWIASNYKVTPSVQAGAHEFNRYKSIIEKQ